MWKMGQILHFNLAYLYNTITYITKLLMQFLRLYETCRMICYSLLSNDVNFVEIGFKWLWRKTTFWCVLMRISPTKSTFSLRKKFLVTLDTHTKKMNPPSIILGGGVHGKTCWLIAYRHLWFLILPLFDVWIAPKYCKWYFDMYIYVYLLSIIGRLCNI